MYGTMNIKFDDFILWNIPCKMEYSFLRSRRDCCLCLQGSWRRV